MIQYWVYFWFDVGMVGIEGDVVGNFQFQVVVGSLCDLYVGVLGCLFYGVFLVFYVVGLDVVGYCINGVVDGCIIQCMFVIVIVGSCIDDVVQVGIDICIGGCVMLGWVYVGIVGECQYVGDCCD